MTDTIFSKIIRKEIPAQIVYEDEECLAFRDIHPQAPVHVLIIPKQPVENLNAALSASAAPLVGRLMLRAAALAGELGIGETGYRVVVNCNRHGGQTVDHLHVHLLGGRQMTWPPG